MSDNEDDFMCDDEEDYGLVSIYFIYFSNLNIQGIKIYFAP